MGDIIQFSRETIGCKGCVHLCQCGKGLWICEEREYMDGSDIYPIIDGKKSDSWWVCEGESYEKSSLQKGNIRRSSLSVSEKENVTESMNKPDTTMSVNTTIKQEFYELVKRQGFRSLNNFATKAGIVTSNLYTNLRGDFRISLERAFQIANTLGVPIIDVLEIFCKEDMTKNRDTVRSHNVSSACANDTSTDGVIDKTYGNS